MTNKEKALALISNLQQEMQKQQSSFSPGDTFSIISRTAQAEMLL